jgi:transcriptional regulator with XRE-family HTH domain
MAIKNKFLQIRLQRGFRFAKEFADFLEINNQQYSRYEANKSQPSLEIVYKSAKRLNIKIEDIIYDDEEEQP